MEMLLTLLKISLLGVYSLYVWEWEKKQVKSLSGGIDPIGSVPVLWTQYSNQLCMTH